MRLSRKDLSKMWNVSLRSIDRYVKDKGLPHHKMPLNGRIYFEEEEIKEWEQRMRNGRDD